jgi:A/G-specific adenine glycosylase
MQKRSLQTIGRRLVKWYGCAARDLPWRVDPTPYRVLVSEFMLQQTVVGTVIGYFDRWMTQFPDVKALAAASERRVLALWQGLGYYRRATNLHRSARMIVADFDGRIPDSRAELLKLPGVGPYIADAVLSFAFHRHVAVVDANVARVFMRLAGREGLATAGDVRRDVAAWTDAALPSGHSSAYNQALMDFGSVVCRSRTPLCTDCFLRDRCEAQRTGRQYDIPTPPKRRLKKIRTVAAVLIREGCVYLRRRPPTGLFAGMWELPGGRVDDAERPRAALTRICRDELGTPCQSERKLTQLVHHYTVHEVTLHAWLCTPTERLPEDATHRWVPLDELDAYPLPSAERKLLDTTRGSRQ